MRQKKVLILGASSTIAQAICRELSARGYALILVARNSEKVRIFRDELISHGGQVLETRSVDFVDFAAVDAMFDEILSAGPVDLALVAHGVAMSNRECRQDPGKFRTMVETNFTSVAFCAERCLRLFGLHGGGELVVISSVSGDRGRAKNYFYGSTKAGLDAFIEGLRSANAGSGINIMNLKPGPVDAAIRPGARRSLLRASPGEVAAVLCSALGKGRHTVYAPRRWRLVMWLVRHMPARLLSKSGI